MTTTTTPASPITTPVDPMRRRAFVAGALYVITFVSINTVRTHTRNVYAKLGVNGRRAAVRRATELDLLARAPQR